MSDFNYENILFLDIETAPIVYEYKQLPDATKKLWDTKFRFNQQETPEEIYKKSGIYAEFAKVICISVAIVMKNKTIRVKSFYGDDEKELLKEFSELLQTKYNKENQMLCAHNGREFDFPFLCRRMLINGIKLPAILDLSGKKPWEVKHLDTMDMWKFGDYKNFTSLNLLAHVFGIPTPKDDIDGSDVARVYYEQKDLNRIVTYCQKDAVTVAQLYLKLKCEEIISQENIAFPLI
ncbi:MAG: 3'-5' exonuclease [Bacteroidetes bacterium]|nr:3'-5' exonuclease [Bacteroidota bacterium]